MTPKNAAHQFEKVLELHRHVEDGERPLAQGLVQRALVAGGLVGGSADHDRRRRRIKAAKNLQQPRAPRLRSGAGRSGSRFVNRQAEIDHCDMDPLSLNDLRRLAARLDAK